jgi:CheY-like chemotaxis protein
MRNDPTYAEIPVIMVSGLGVEQALDQMLAGLPRPEVYLEKPIVLEPFVEAVHRLVNGREGS